jgi:hypothetical protein
MNILPASNKNICLQSMHWLGKGQANDGAYLSER